MSFSLFKQSLVMSKAEDSLIIIDSTYAKVTSLGKNYICKLEARKAKLRVSCACLDDKELWASNYSLDALDKQKRALDMESLSWQIFFEKIKEALGNDDLFISMDEDQLTMTIWCSFDDKQQTSVTFELARAPDNDNAFVQLVFSLVDQVRAGDAAKNNGFKAEVKSSLPVSTFSMQSQPSAMIVDTLTVDNNRAANQSKGVKRKAGRSLINPRIKRIVPHYTKIDN